MSSFNRLLSDQLDSLISKFRPASELQKPANGWVHALRTALGMTAAQLGRRIGVSRETIKTLERSEARGTIRLDSLDRLAKGLGCRVVYAIVPEEGRSVEALRRARALELARRQYARVSHSMALEAQGLDPRKAEHQIAQIADDLLADSPRKLWQ